MSLKDGGVTVVIDIIHNERPSDETESTIFLMNSQLIIHNVIVTFENPI